jgi:hypothetical protein
VCVFRSLCIYLSSLYSFVSLGKGPVSSPSSFCSFFLVKPGYLQWGPLICRSIFDVKRNLLFHLWSSNRVLEGVGISFPSPSETDSEDAVFNTVPSSFWGCASGSFRTLTVLCESPVKILYLVLLITKRESQSMRRISLWPSGSGCLSGILQCSVWSPGLR